ncbi:MAG: Tat pathway signal sequence domain protein, partial [Pseudomonadota bacterium]
ILIQNETELAFSALSLDLVMFDPDGIISKRLAVEMAPLRAGKTSVKVFGIDGAACGGLGRILVNDVLSCEVGGSARNDCLEMIETASRGPVDLIN